MASGLFFSLFSSSVAVTRGRWVGLVYSRLRFLRTDRDTEETRLRGCWRLPGVAEKFKFCVMNTCEGALCKRDVIPLARRYTPELCPLKEGREG